MAGACRFASKGTDQALGTVHEPRAARLLRPAVFRGACGGGSPISPWWKQQRRIDGLISAGLFLSAFIALWATEASVGFVRDESVYFAAAQSYAAWLQQLFRDPSTAFTDAAIVRAFDFNHEHPAMMKLLFGISHHIFHQGLG